MTFANCEAYLIGTRKEGRMIERESFDWGLRLTAKPFSGGPHEKHTIQAEIGHYRYNSGCDTRIIFPAVTSAKPFRLGDAQVWNEAMHALVAETRSVVAQMKADAAEKKPPKKTPKKR